MQTRHTRLRLGRRVRKGQLQVEGFGSHAEQQIDQYVFARFGRLKVVKRFVFGWLGLMVLLISAMVGQNLALGGYYQSLKGVPGGIYNEGVLGQFTTANPLFANNEADATVSHLIFAGLFNYDKQGRLVPDLAKDFKADAHGTTYTVHLKPHLKWQDGRNLTSRDILFTYQLIQNPDVQSPLRSSWRDITVTAPDDNTVIFKLPGALASFPYNLTNGIVPEHLLAKVPPTDLRSADFNSVHPVGAGPFEWQGVEVSGGDPRTAQEQVGLTPFENYQGGKPKLQKFVVKVFASEKQLRDAFVGQQLTAVNGLNRLPEEVRGESGVLQHNLPLRAATMVFFKNSEGVLADKAVRQALVKSADIGSIIKQLDYPARAVDEPILKGQLGYDKTLTQPGYDLKAAQASLELAGWTKSKNGLYTKDGKILTITLTAADTEEYHLVAGQLQKQWQRLGVKLNTQFLVAADFQSALTYHNYEAILNGISIGADPDVFVYWDSSQIDIRSDNRLNLSEYKNPAADAALEAGRTRLDATLRTIKYKPFLQSWQQDSPALGLYQPRVLYLTNGVVYGLEDHPVNTAIDRFADVQNWEIRQAKVTD